MRKKNDFREGLKILAGKCSGTCDRQHAIQRIANGLAKLLNVFKYLSPRLPNIFVFLVDYTPNNA